MIGDRDELDGEVRAVLALDRDDEPDDAADRDDELDDAADRDDELDDAADRDDELDDAADRDDEDPAAPDDDREVPDDRELLGAGWLDRGAAVLEGARVAGADDSPPDDRVWGGARRSPRDWASATETDRTVIASREARVRISFRSATALPAAPGAFRRAWTRFPVRRRG